LFFNFYFCLLPFLTFTEPPYYFLSFRKKGKKLKSALSPN